MVSNTVLTRFPAAGNLSVDTECETSMRCDTITTDHFLYFLVCRDYSKKPCEHRFVCAGVCLCVIVCICVLMMNGAQVQVRCKAAGP